MERMFDDSVKQKLLDSLAKEPPMVISTAYAYAKNYVRYGEDITKAWSTAVQQTSVIREVRQKAWMAAYDSFKSDYEARLKADLKDILVELQLEIEEIEVAKENTKIRAGERCMKGACTDLIQQKINELKAETGE